MDNTEKQPLLVLDLDGTLVDTASDLVSTLNVVLGSEGLPPVAVDEGLRMVGNGARAMLTAGLRASGEEPEDERLDVLFDRFLAHYRDHLADYSRPFPGAVEALDRFESAGWRLAICTNKLEGLSRALLEQLDLAARFAAIAGQDSVSRRKPDPAHLTETIALAGGDPRRAVMVGDSEIDIRTARQARIPVVAVTFGYSARPIRELGADVVIDHYDELYDAAAALLERAP